MCVYVCVCVCVYVYVYVYIYIYVDVDVYVYVYIYRNGKPRVLSHFQNMEKAASSFIIRNRRVSMQNQGHWRPLEAPITRPNHQ